MFKFSITLMIAFFVIFSIGIVNAATANSHLHKNDIQQPYTHALIEQRDIDTCPPRRGDFCQCFKNEIYQACRRGEGAHLVCANMRLVYYGMMARYGSLEKACRDNNTTKKDIAYCISDWSCYLHGYYYGRGGKVRCDRHC